MSHSPHAHPNPQPAFPTAPTALLCPICGGSTVASWWVADLLLCEHCYWSGRAAACKAVNDDDSSATRKRADD